LRQYIFDILGLWHNALALGVFDYWLWEVLDFAWEEWTEVDSDSNSEGIELADSLAQVSAFHLWSSTC
jgi:hypothetical protein